MVKQKLTSSSDTVQIKPKYINKINLLFTSSPTQQNAKIRVYHRLCHVSPMKSVQGHSD